MGHSVSPHWIEIAPNNCRYHESYSLVPHCCLDLDFVCGSFLWFSPPSSFWQSFTTRSSISCSDYCRNNSHYSNYTNYSTNYPHDPNYSNHTNYSTNYPNYPHDTNYSNHCSNYANYPNYPHDPNYGTNYTFYSSNNS